jgi:hypothetical protein
MQAWGSGAAMPVVFNPLSIFKSTPTSNGEGMSRKLVQKMRRLGCGEGANNRLGMYRI